MSNIFVTALKNMLSLDTHAYDGGRLNAADLPGLNRIAPMPLDEKKAIAGTLLASKLHPLALHFLQIVVTQMGTPANYDATNGLCADDLLVLASDYRDNPDFQAMLELQLLDMATGFCPQGRTHRLFQLLLAFT